MKDIAGLTVISTLIQFCIISREPHPISSWRAMIKIATPTCHVSPQLFPLSEIRIHKIYRRPSHSAARPRGILLPCVHEFYIRSLGDDFGPLSEVAHVWVPANKSSNALASLKFHVGVKVLVRWRLNTYGVNRGNRTTRGNGATPCILVKDTG